MVDLDPELIVPLRAEGDEVPLFCVHPVSGSAFAYTPLVPLLRPAQPVYAFEAPGFDGDRRPPVRSLPALSAEYVRTLRAFRPAGEYRLFGWSFGGVLAFDMAQRLTAAGATVSRLVMVDAGLPWVADLPPEKEILRRFMTDILGIAGAPPHALDAVFAAHPADVDPAVLLAAVSAARVLPEDIDADLLRDRYAVFRAHLEALFGFEVSGAYDGPVVHIMAAGSPAEYMRWNTVATNLTEHTIPGTHYSIWTGDNLLRLTELVGGVLG